MFNRRPTKAKNDAWAVMKNSGATAIPVLHNDVVAPPKTLQVTGVTQPANGSVTYTSTGVSYTPNTDFTCTIHAPAFGKRCAPLDPITSNGMPIPSPSASNALPPSSASPVELK